MTGFTLSFLWVQYCLFQLAWMMLASYVSRFPANDLVYKLMNVRSASAATALTMREGVDSASVLDMSPCGAHLPPLSRGLFRWSSF